MGRREKPLADGPLREFAEDLRTLRVQAGNPTYRELSRTAVYSVSALAAATSGQMLPTLEVTLAYVRACGGDVETWRRRWEGQRDLLNQTNPSLLPPEARTALGTEGLEARKASPRSADPADAGLPAVPVGSGTVGGTAPGAGPEPVRFEQLGRGEPRRVGPLRLHGRLGGGAMGVVYLGSTPAGRPVAVKVIRPEYARDAMFRRRFAHEVAAARQVAGGHTPAVVDADTEADLPWLATEFVPGPSLGGTVAESGPLPEAVVWGLAAGIAEALSAIHAAGVVHRDLKPSNILLDRDGPKVIDFGISRAVDGTAVTSTGVRVGTVGYTAPEQAERGISAPAGDVFALGAVLAYAATGIGAFGTGSDAEILYRIVHQPPIAEALACKDKKLRALIESCLSKDPDARPTPEQIITLAAETAESDAAGPAPALPAAVAARIASRSHGAADLLARSRNARRVRVGLAPLVLILAIVTVGVLASNTSAPPSRPLGEPPATAAPNDQLPPTDDQPLDSAAAPGPASDSPPVDPAGNAPATPSVVVQSALAPGPALPPNQNTAGQAGPGPVQASPSVPVPAATPTTPPTTQAQPPKPAPVDFVWGPGCPGTATSDHDQTGGTWTSWPGGDYSGTGCSGQTVYAWNTAGAGYQWTTDISPGLRCKVSAYIPTYNAGAYNAQYDFWSLNSAGHLSWLGWAGRDINQQTASGWTGISTTITMPQDAVRFRITVKDDRTRDTSTRYLGAGDMHLTCQ